MHISIIILVDVICMSSVRYCDFLFESLLLLFSEDCYGPARQRPIGALHDYAMKDLFIDLFSWLIRLFILYWYVIFDDISYEAPPLPLTAKAHTSTHEHCLYKIIFGDATYHLLFA
jgi:hypothetical protein